MATARASPSPVRRLLRTTTARVARYPDGMWATAWDSDSTRSAAPVSGRPRPSTRAHTGRASAAAATAMTRPVAPTVAPNVRRVSSLSAHRDRGRVVGLAEHLDDVLAVAALRDRTQFVERLVQFGTAGRAIGDAGHAQQPGGGRAAPGPRGRSSRPGWRRCRRAPGRTATPGRRPPGPAPGCPPSGRPGR